MHPFLRGQTLYIANATLQGQLFQVAKYPGAVISANKSHQVHGEIYRLLKPSLTLQKLDDYEECSDRFPKPHEYKRTLQRVVLATGESMQAWVYLYQYPLTGLKRIENGDYVAFFSSRTSQL